MIIHSTTLTQLQRMVNFKPTDNGRHSQHLYFLRDLKIAVITDGHIMRVEYLPEDFPTATYGNFKLPTSTLKSFKPVLGVRCELPIMPLELPDLKVVDIFEIYLQKGENRKNAVAYNKCFNPVVMKDFFNSLPNDCNCVFSVSYEEKGASPIYFYNSNNLFLGILMPMKLREESFIFNQKRKA